MSRRTEQIASTLLETLREVFSRGFQDPRIRGLITVTEIDLAPDLATASVLISVLPEDHEELTLHGLRAAASHIRHEVGERLDMRRVPTFTFKLDRTLKKQVGVIQALARAAAEREARQPTTPPPEQEPSP